MHRVLFRWFGRPVYSYSTMLYLGIVLGIYAQLYVALLVGLDVAAMLTVTLMLLTIALVGARLLHVVVNWSRPAEDIFGKGLDDQYTAEIYYRLKVFKVMAITPDEQLIIDPALNPQESSIWVFGLQARLPL